VRSRTRDFSQEPPVPPTVRVRRRLLLALPLLLVACEDSEPSAPTYPPLSYTYLRKIRLMVGSIDINDTYLPPDTPDSGHVEGLAPVAPADALRQMATDRLAAAGSGGRAVFTIEEASLVQSPSGFVGTMRVRLDVTGADGSAHGSAEARVSRTYSTPDSSDDGTRAALYALVKLLMDDMNVEFEYQVKRRLRPFLAPEEGLAPSPAPVEQEDLNGSPGAPPPPAGTLTPPMGTLTPPPGVMPSPQPGTVPPPAPATPPPPSLGTPVPLAPPAQ
jgi:hypothetical protein